jgi:undecaprenyl phosphate-alpha-L-ara4FN deformylase
VRVALKIDVDTFRGMRDGLPELLRILGGRGIRASIFVSMGPDHSGRAIRRLVTKRGFLLKMIKTRAVSLYGPRTLLYGTLLPGPRIAAGNADLFRRIEAEGHEAGVHGWDHVRWQDGLPGFSEPAIARELERSFLLFSEITGHAPKATAAPGWIATARSLAVQDRLELLYCSDVRGYAPFQPRVAGRVFRTPQIPTTLPTLDEMIGQRELFAGAGRARDRSHPYPAESWINEWLVAEALRQAGARPGIPIVHTVHTEVEGLSRAALFKDLLDRLLAEGARFARLDEIASDLGAGPGDEQGRSAGALPLPVCDVHQGELPGRSGTLALQADPCRNPPDFRGNRGLP